MNSLDSFFSDSSVRLLLETGNVRALTVENDTIVQRTGWDYLAYLFHFHQSTHDEKLNYGTNNLVKKLQIAITTVSPENLTAAQNDTIRKLFQKLGKMSEAQFDRSVIHSADQALIYTLAPHLKQLKENIRGLNQALEENQKLVDRFSSDDVHYERSKLVEKKEKARLEIKIAKAQLVVSLGHGRRGAKGMSETFLIKNLNEKLLGVYKAEAKYMSLFSKMYRSIRTFFGGQFSKLSPKKGESASEVAAYLVDRFFGFNVVPPSKQIELGGTEGVFQMAAESFKKAQDPKTEMKEAKEVQAILNQKKYDDSELTHFQLFALHDYLIGNLDAHDKNWFIQVLLDKIVGIIGIDKGNAFLIKNPDKGSIAARNHLGWKEFEIAWKPFTQEAIKKMQMMTPQAIEECINQCGTLLDEEMKYQLRARAKIVQMFGVRGESTKLVPALLAHYTNDQEIMSALDSYNRHLA